VEVRYAPDLPRPIFTEAQQEANRPQGVDLLTPATLLKREEFLLRDQVLRVARLLEARDYLRVDVRLRDGLPYIIDVNANPSLAAGGSVLRAAQAARLPLPRLLEHLLRYALERAPTTLPAGT